MRILRNEPLSKHTTFRIGGPAKYFCAPRTINELKEALQFAKAGENSNSRLPIFILGSGSNILISDKGFNGLAINPRIDDISINGTDVVVGAGLPLQHLLSILAQKGLTGLEFMTGIPGSVGGSVCMNAGTGENAIGKAVVSVWVMNENGIEKAYSFKQSGFGYRKSAFQKKGLIITRVQLKLKKGKTINIRSKMKQLWQKRLSGQPYSLPSAGSVFKNPKGDFAGRLIEAAGLKGKRAGKAEISKKHANFIV
ncbi:MAG: UDP-N-acetylmuramate dehydrogenase, partial [Candidatus Margulisiibacteriota bacterium]